MHIIHVYRTYFEDRTGIPTVINTLTNSIDEPDIKQEVLFLAKNPQQIPKYYDGAILTPFKRELSFSSADMTFTQFFKFRNALKKADVIHYHFPWPFMDLLHLSLLGSKPKTIVTYHSDIVKQKKLNVIYKPLMSAFLKNMDHIIATSDNYLNSSLVLQSYREKTSSIPLGLADRNLTKPLPLESTRFSNIKKPFALFIGSLRYYKGLDYLIAAAEKMDCQILIAGSGKNQSNLEEITHCKAPNVIFLGEVSENEKAALLHACRVVVFPSHVRSEAYGLTLVEACMFGKPMISCEIGTGTSYVNQHEKTGLVIPPADTDALRSAIKQLMDNSDLAEKMGLAARARFLKYLTAEKMAKSYLSLYKKLIP